MTLDSDLKFASADIWRGDHEQPSLLGRLLGSCLHETLNLGLLGWGLGHLDRLRCDGFLHQLPHDIPAVDLLCGLLAVPTLLGSCLCSRLHLWMVIKQKLVMWINLSLLNAGWSKLLRFSSTLLVLCNLVSAAQILNQQSCCCWNCHNIRVKDLDGMLFNQILLTPISCLAF